MDYSSRPDISSKAEAVQLMWNKLFPQKTYLYYNGNEYKDITGGWDFAFGGTVTRSSDGLNFSCNTSSRINLSHNNPISFPSYATKICVLFKNLSMNSACDIISCSATNTHYNLSNAVPTAFAGANVPYGTYENLLVEMPFLPYMERTGYISPIFKGATGATTQYKVLTATISEIWYE